MQFFEQSGGTLLYRNKGETVALTPWGADSLRVRAVFSGDISDESAALLLPADDSAKAAVISIDGLHASITNGGITARLDCTAWQNALQISFYDAGGRLLLEEQSAGGALMRKARAFTPLAGASCRLKATFASNPDERIYGMGQYQQEHLNLKGCNLELAHRNSQCSIPFYVSSLGYGFLWHNPAIGEVHFGLNTTEWISESTRQLDYWITAAGATATARATPAAIVERYTEVTGRAPEMPEYGLGFWQCKLRYYNQEEVLRVAREYKSRGIPLDVIVIDYYHWPRCGDWRFDSEYFPEPAAMVRELQAMGIQLMVSVWPQVDFRSENYAELQQQGLLVKSNAGVDVQMLFHGNNVFIDATNPRTRRYVWQKCKQNYADVGIRLFWLDEAEPEFTGYAFANYRYHAGTVLECGNIYPREYARLFYEGQRESGQTDVVNLIRCAWAGSQRYGALVWSGDILSCYEDFRKQIAAGIHMGLAGIPWWTTDIGGFHNGRGDSADFRELLVRWFEYGTFCPVMRLHGARQPFTQIVNKAGEVREQTGADNEIWSFGEDVYAILRRYVGIREKLRAYTRALMHEAHTTGAPVIRALFYEFPADSRAWETRETYLYGSDLLVAPVCYEHAKSRSVYLPRGADWLELSTGRTLAGGTDYVADAPLGTIPVFQRIGGKYAALLPARLME